MKIKMDFITGVILTIIGSSIFFLFGWDIWCSVMIVSGILLIILSFIPSKSREIKK